QLHVLELEHALVLLDDGVARACQDFDQSRFVQIVQNSDHRQTADKFGDQSEADQVLGLGFLQKLGVTLAGFGKLAFFFFASAEAHGLLADASPYDLFESYESSAADEQDVRGIDRRELLVGVLAPALWRDIGDRAFQNLEQRLLYAFAAYVAGD